jgi:methylthioribose-1-phosphate isomerase
VRNQQAPNAAALQKRLEEVCEYLASSRPTAVNLVWALRRIKNVAERHGEQSSREILEAILAECLEMVEEDIRVCRAIGEHGLGLIEQAKNAAGEIAVLTHCNAGSLATVQYGTALAPIYLAAQRGDKLHVWADETRPLLQGSRLTAFELQANAIPVTVICDNMAATVMRQGKIKAVIVGADRIAANGDVANKIGTFGVAILARNFQIPFYVAAPISTVDLSLADGSQIPIEERDREEIGAPPGVEVYNPAFDVTPAKWISAIITEKGVLRAPYETSLAAACKQK